jgi:hypothetical protein
MANSVKQRWIRAYLHIIASRRHLLYIGRKSERQGYFAMNRDIHLQNMKRAEIYGMIKIIK